MAAARPSPTAGETGRVDHDRRGRGRGPVGLVPQPSGFGVDRRARAGCDAVPCRSCSRRSISSGSPTRALWAALRRSTVGSRDARPDRLARGHHRARDRWTTAPLPAPPPRRPQRVLVCTRGVCASRPAVALGGAETSRRSSRIISGCVGWRGSESPRRRSVCSTEWSPALQLQAAVNDGAVRAARAVRAVVGLDDEAGTPRQPCPIRAPCWQTQLRSVVWLLSGRRQIAQRSKTRDRAAQALEHPAAVGTPA
jgi:hypothetical protein